MKKENYPQALPLGGNFRYEPHFFKTLLDVIPAAIYHSSYDREKDLWRIRYVSQGVEGLLGYKPRELENRQSFKSLALSNLQHYQLFSQLTPENPRFRLTFEFRAADGRGKWVSDDGIILFDEQGRMTGSAGVFVDISDHKAKELSIQEENLRLRTTLRSPACLGGMVGKSPAMQKVFSRIIKMALSTVPVVIMGESGTGKELAARAIHDLSNRGAKPFVAVNCSSISENLFESEFFGSIKGAFTGAASDRLGYLDAAAGGTLFLDEVGEIPLAMQTKLLRVLDGYGYMPVGGSKVRYADFRLISATNRNFERLLSQGLMREDFYYRLNALSLYLPPLRERAEDIPLLVDNFLRKSRFSRAVLPEEFVHRLTDHSWPGNIRELQNVISRHLALQETEFTEAGPQSWRQVLPEEIPTGLGLEVPAVGNGPVRAESYQEFERARLLAALNLKRWQVEEAARHLGLSRSTMYRKMKRYGLGLR